MRVTIEPVQDASGLETDWLPVQAMSRISPFVSWHWIGHWVNWVRNHDPLASLKLLRVTEGTVTAGLAVIAVRNARRWGAAHCVGYLHATGNADLDALYIEFNGLCAPESLKDRAVDSVVKAFSERSIGLDELVVPGVEDAVVWQEAAARYGLLTTVQTLQSPFIELAAIGRDERDVFALAGRKSRHSMRQAEDAYLETCGALSVGEAQSGEEALSWLRQLAKLNIRHWRSQNLLSSFENSAFMQFHEGLVQQAPVPGTVRIYRVCAGSCIVGYLYTFVRDGRCYFYQSGYDYNLLQRHNQPGWLVLKLILERLQSEGMKTFEFMAGDSAYKRRFTAKSRSVSWLTFERPTVRGRLTRGLARARAAAGLVKRQWLS